MEIRDEITRFVEGAEHLGAASVAARKDFVLAYEASLSEAFAAAYYRAYDAARRAEVLAELDEHAELLPRLAPLYRAKLATVKQIAGETARRFREIFDIGLSFPLYCWSALAWTDASLVEHEATDGIALNFRRIVRYDEETLRILFAHEAFHIHQRRLFGTSAATGLSTVEDLLWSEGWATYASSVVVPGLPAWRYFAYYARDDEAYRAVQGAKPAVARALLEALDASDERTAMRFFSGDRDDTAPFPPRSGYLLGFELAELLGDLGFDPPRFKVAVRKFLFAML